MRILRGLLVFVVIILIAITAVWFSGGTSDLDEISIAEKEIGIDLDSRRVDVGDIKLHVVFAGPDDGEPVILLHGFPEFWFAWRHQIELLANAGYRVAAPDLRGYNRSDKPKSRQAYTQRAYADDILGLMNAQGWGQAYVAAHDIGAGVAWRMIFENPERVRAALIFSIGHPLAFADVGNESEISWYRDFLKLPILPELLARTYGPTLTANNLRDTSRPDTFSEADMKVYKAAWDRDHAMDTMFGSYRAENPPISGIPADGRTSMPVKLVFGAQDKFLSLESAVQSKKYLGEENVEIYTDLSHWMLSEEPALMGEEIIGFFGQGSLADTLVQ